MLSDAEITPLVEAKAKGVVSAGIRVFRVCGFELESGGLRLRILLHRAAAVDADPDNPEQMLGDLEPVFRRHRVLDRFELRGEELDDLPALGTDHVVVMLVFVVVLVMRAPVAEPHLTCEA